MKILEFHAIIIKMSNHKISIANHENQEILRILYENYENHKNLRMPYGNHENQKKKNNEKSNNSYDNQ